MLLAAPKFDEATLYSHLWSLRLATELGLTELDKVLLEDDATRKNFEREIPNHNLFVFYDHGDEDSLVAQGGQENMLDLENVGLVADKEVYTLACLSAKRLGVEAWRKGAVFWGYTDVFGFTTSDEEIFCEAQNAGLILKRKEGLYWPTALERAKEKFNELIDKTEDPWAKTWLRHNRDCLVCYNGEAPKSSCFWRNLAIRLFGPSIGWKIPSPKRGK